MFSPLHSSAVDSRFPSIIPPPRVLQDLLSVSIPGRREVAFFRTDGLSRLMAAAVALGISGFPVMWRVDKGGTGATQEVLVPGVGLEPTRRETGSGF
jgi:hypothetical protein